MKFSFKLKQRDVLPLLSAGNERFGETPFLCLIKINSLGLTELFYCRSVAHICYIENKYKKKWDIYTLNNNELSNFLFFF